jgi:hypothetical protein
MALDKGWRRTFILGSALEFVGLVALGVRFGAKVGGVALLVIGGAFAAAGLALELRTLLRATGRL